jgi:hypothetical protein
MVVRWGGVGQNGNGGHAHNDLSSYELSYGATVVVDPGTYLYTADVGARDAFRSAPAHNVLVVDGRDMHPLPAGEPFRLPAHARFTVDEWSEGDERIVLGGRHDGFRRPGAHVSCRRRITLERATGTVDVLDEVDAAGRHTLESLVHLAPGCTAAHASRSELLVRVRGNLMLRIRFWGADTGAVEPGFVSAHYGDREPALVIRASAVVTLPARLRYRIARA